MRHTLLGYAIHHAMAIFWALPFEAVLARARPAAARRYRLAAALATAGIACFVDYRLTPRRLRPGFEKQLGRGSLALVYLAFGIGLGLGAGFREVPARSPASRIA